MTHMSANLVKEITETQNGCEEINKEVKKNKCSSLKNKRKQITVKIHQSLNQPRTPAAASATYLGYVQV